MYRLRFLLTMIACLIRPTRGLLEVFERSFWAIPLLDTDISRLFTQTYSQYMGVCRWQFMFSSPFRDAALKKGWAPITTAETIVYKRAVKAFSRVTVRTRMLCWTDRRFYLEQVFLVKGELHARCLLEGMIRGGKGKGLSPPEAFAELGVKELSPPVPAEIAAWLPRLES